MFRSNNVKKEKKNPKQYVPPHDHTNSNNMTNTPSSRFYSLYKHCSKKKKRNRKEIENKTKQNKSHEKALTWELAGNEKKERKGKEEEKEERKTKEKYIYTYINFLLIRKDLVEELCE